MHSSAPMAILTALVACAIVIALAVAVGDIMGDRRRLRDHGHPADDDADRRGAPDDDAR